MRTINLFILLIAGTNLFLAGCGKEAELTGRPRGACSEQCVGSTPHCDRETLQCVGCIDDNDCGGSKFCSSAKQCLSANAPMVSVEDVTSVESSMKLEFTVRISEAPTHKPVTVHYATSSGTAVSGSDFQSMQGTLTFSPTSPLVQAIVVEVEDDSVHEPNENFTLTLDSPMNAEIQRGTATGLINNDDVLNVFIRDTSANEDSGNIVFSVELTNSSSQTVSVDYATFDGSAKAASDYTARNGTLEFAPGDKVKSVSVPLAPDTTVEDPENFSVTLSNAVVATLGDAVASGTINNDDGSVLVSIADATLVEANTNLSFTVSLNKVTDKPVSINFSTTNGSAAGGADFTAVSGGTLTIPTGQTSGTISISIAQDTLDEANETFTVNLTSATNATLSDASATGTITDNDDPPTISIDDATLPSESGANLSFSVRLSTASSRNITVNYASANGTALAGAAGVGDYQATSGTLTISASQTSGTINVPIHHDLMDEADENFTVSISAPTNATILDATGIGTIMDNDNEPTLSVADRTVSEINGSITFTVSLSAVSGRAITVQYATSNDTAMSGSDFAATSGTLTIPAGQMSAPVVVSLIDDFADEANETFLFTLSSPVNAGMSDGSATASITDDDDTPTLSVANGSASENAGVLTFTATLSAASGQNVSVLYSTGNNSAQSGSDYTAVSSATLTFAPGETSKTISVIIFNDDFFENNEMFTLALSSATNAALVTTSVTGAILEDDFPVISVAAGSGSTCAVLSNGSLWCWGRNTSGEVGDGTTTRRTTPVRVGSALNWKSVSAGLLHFCAVKTNGELYCWGSNTYGQLGDGSITNRNQPTKIGALTWQKVDAGHFHTCALSSFGSGYCWGSNFSGALGSESPEVQATPKMVNTGDDPIHWIDISAGGSHSCAVDEDEDLWCWGENTRGQLGLGDNISRNAPTLTNSSFGWSSVSCENQFSCGVRAGSSYCWGYNFQHQVGDGTSADRNVPTLNQSATNWTYVATGYQHACGVKNNGTVWCWGYNHSAQLGDGTQIDRYVPTQTAISNPAVSRVLISSGSGHTCATRMTGELDCWGANNEGQIGDGTQTMRLSPVLVAFP